MKKLLFISLLFVAVGASAQSGIKLSGRAFTNVSDSITITALYAISDYSYRAIDSTVTIQTWPCRSIYAARNVQLLNMQSFNIPMLNFTVKSSIGYPTPSSLLSLATSYYATLGFTVTPF